MVSRSELHKIYIADGFIEDCEELMHQYLKRKVLNYQGFCDVWKEMKFAYIFQGRLSTCELGELSEEVLYIAKKLLTNKTNTMEESIACLFLLYGLAHLQPFKNFAHVRLVPEDVEAIKRLEIFARDNKRFDVLYILGSLLIKGPLQYHLSEREYGLEKCIRKSFEEHVSVEKLSHIKGVMHKNEEIHELLQMEANISKQYKNAKMVIHGKDHQERSLSYADEHLAGELAASLRELVRYGASRPQTKDKPVPDSEDDGAKAAAIKDRAMRKTVQQMRHLVSVDNTKSNELTTKSTTGRISNSDVKRTKRTTASSKRKNRKKKRLIEDEHADVNEDDDEIKHGNEANLSSLPMINIDEEMLETIPTVIEYIDEMGEGDTTASFISSLSKFSHLPNNPTSPKSSLSISSDVSNPPTSPKSCLSKSSDLPSNLTTSSKFSHSKSIDLPNNIPTIPKSCVSKSTKLPNVLRTNANSCHLKSTNLADNPSSSSKSRLSKSTDLLINLPTSPNSSHPKSTDLPNNTPASPNICLSKSTDLPNNLPTSPKSVDSKVICGNIRMPKSKKTSDRKCISYHTKSRFSKLGMLTVANTDGPNRYYKNKNKKK